MEGCKDSKEKPWVSSQSASVDRDDIPMELAGIPPFVLDLQQKQPTLNLMTCGDVSHGKSTLLAALSGEKTGKHSAELKGNMTIRLGYTACKIWKCLRCPRLDCYFSTHSDAALTSIKCPKCGAQPNASHHLYHTGDSAVYLLRHVSFVDVPGHAQLMQTMVSATSVADACVFVVDASKRCPGRQAAQHMDAIHLLGLMRSGRLIVAQNKIDLCGDKQNACRSYEEIRNYLGTFDAHTRLAYETPIIPMSAQSRLNMDALCHAIVFKLPKYSDRLKRMSSMSSSCAGDFYMNIIRSFDVNKARDLRSVADIDKIAGGVLGGAVLDGHCQVGQRIEIRPGYVMRRQVPKQKESRLQQQYVWSAQPIRATIKSLQYGKHLTSMAHPGGNVGVQTSIDPSLTKGDKMCGHVVIDASHPKPPPIFTTFVMSYTFLSTASSATDARSKKKKATFKKGEEIRVNIGSFKRKAEVLPSTTAEECKLDGADGVLVVLEAPICARVGDSVGICRQNKQQQWAFVAGGVIRRTKNIFIASDADKLAMASTTGEATEPQQQRQKVADANVCGNAVDVVSKVKDQMVHISYQQRSGRKGVTTIVGLPDTISFKKMVKRMKKEWSTGATLVSDEMKGMVIQVQGDKRYDVASYLVTTKIVKKTQVQIHGV